MRHLRRLKSCLMKRSAFPSRAIRFGIDGIVGLFPGLGDVLAGLLSCIIPIAAWVRGVPYVTLAAHDRQRRHRAFSSASIPLPRRRLRHRLENESPQLPAAQRHSDSRAATPGRTGCFLLAARRALIAIFLPFPSLLLIWLLDLADHPLMIQSLRSRTGSIRSAIQSKNTSGRSAVW